MKKSILLLISIISLLAFFVTGYTEERDYSDSNRDFGPGMIRERGGRRLIDYYRGPMMMGNFGVMAGFFNPEIITIAENYRLKIQKIYLDASQSKISLDSKRKDLYIRLTDLAEKYNTDKTVSKEIIGVIKDLNSIQNQIRDINQIAMKKIQVLHEEREKEIETANDSWIKKLESDNKELERYLSFIKDRPYRYIVTNK